MRFPAKIKNTSSLLPVVSYLLMELFYIGLSLVWTDGRTGVWSRDYQNFSDGWITKFLGYAAPL